VRDGGAFVGAVVVIVFIVVNVALLAWPLLR
jgi:hypothetical protein